MKTSIRLGIPFLFAGLTFLFSAYQSKKSKTVLPKSLEKLKAVTYIPNGTLDNRSYQAFYMFTNEVCNLHYNEFLAWLKKNGKQELLEKARPDSTLWTQEVDANGIDLYYKRYSLMHELPVVNISKEAAEAYCAWLSEIWNTQQNEFVVEFRLPTAGEWEYAASGGQSLQTHPYPWNGVYCRDAKGLYLAQHKAIGLVYGPQKTGSFNANTFGLYNMSGNVSEMVSDKNISKGGSWNSNEKDIRITAENNLKKSPFTGFRPVMTFLKRSK